MGACGRHVHRPTHRRTAPGVPEGHTHTHTHTEEAGTRGAFTTLALRTNAVRRRASIVCVVCVVCGLQVLKKMVDEVNCHPILIRLAWHDSGTYDAKMPVGPYLSVTHTTDMHT